MSRSRAEAIAALSKEGQKEFYAALSEAEAAALVDMWEFWARPEQMEPGSPGAAEARTDWSTWLVLSGRGFGKTRTGSEFVRRNVCGDTPLTGGGYGMVAVVAETASDARHVVVEGPAGILACHPKAFRPKYEPSIRRLTWPNGAVAQTYNATEPDQLRGPQHDLAFCDELAKWKYGKETWDMLQFGLRLGTLPKAMVATTPRPIPLLKEILKDPGTVVTRGSTFENRAHLAPSFLDKVVRKYEGTRLGRQELNAEILDDIPGALWTRASIDDHRIQDEDGLPDMERIVVGVDPAITVDPESGAETGIVTCGLGVDGRGYVFDDLSGFMSPDGWARKAVSAIDMRDGDAVVAEINQGGDMVERTLRSARASLKVIKVRAARGKVTRAEPIAALYEQGRVSHVGIHAALEDQMMLFTPEGITGDGSADRVDALVWALTALFNRIVRSTGRKKKIDIQGIGSYDPHSMGVR